MYCPNLIYNKIKALKHDQPIEETIIDSVSLDETIKEKTNELIEIPSELIGKTVILLCVQDSMISLDSEGEYQMSSKPFSVVTCIVSHNIKNQKTFYKRHFRFGKQNGWKFHVSIDDYDQSNLAKAWDIVVKTLSKYRVYKFKVCQENIHMDSNLEEAEAKNQYEQRGKQITIYDYWDQFAGGRKQIWEIILREITGQFIAQEIKPSYKPPYDRSIKGSSFFSYRNDERGRLTSYNPKSDKDPFINIDLSDIKKQPPSLKWGFAIDLQTFTKNKIKNFKPSKETLHLIYIKNEIGKEKLILIAKNEKQLTKISLTTDKRLEKINSLVANKTFSQLKENERLQTEIREILNVVLKFPIAKNLKKQNMKEQKNMGWLKEKDNFNGSNKLINKM